MLASNDIPQDQKIRRFQPSTDRDPQRRLAELTAVPELTAQLGMHVLSHNPTILDSRTEGAAKRHYLVTPIGVVCHHVWHQLSPESYMIATVKNTATEQRHFPLRPRSARELRVGDFWAVALPGGGFGCLQVTDLKKSGPGALKTLVAGVVDWRGPSPPVEADLAGRSILEQGLTRIEAFSEPAGKVIGNTNRTTRASALASNYRDFEVGTITHVYGWRALPTIVERVLVEKGSA